MSHSLSPTAQLRFDDLGTPLSQVTFVIVDLETTGGSADDAITEIGAVKVRGGEVLGEFTTLVRPTGSIPPMITVLTGITNSMVADAPRIESVLPSFLEFMSGSVLVAHNAPFDVGFLVRACTAHGLPWPKPTVVDTVRLARAVLPRTEVRNAKLSTLALFFRAPVQPTHRALDDAKATVHVLHGLFERLGTLHVNTLDDLLGYSRQVPETVRRKATLADGLPDAPGVYLFKDDSGRVLYVGTSRSLRTRVRSYFTAAETRSRMREMVRLATEVVPIVCPTPLEAQVRELRLIAEHKPPYNKRSRRQDRALWLRLTDEPFPRLSIVRSPRGADAAIGPFSRRDSAEAAAACLVDAIPLRQCTDRVSVKRPTEACILAELKRCGAPCSGAQSRADYALVVDQARQAMLTDPSFVVTSSFERMTARSKAGQYEHAAVLRDRLTAFLGGAAWSQRARALADCDQLVAAAPSSQLRDHWEVVVIRHGRLVASTTAKADATMSASIQALIATSPHADAQDHGLPGGTAEETSLVLAWLEAPGVRPAVVDGTWCSPVNGAAALASRADRPPVDALVARGSLGCTDSGTREAADLDAADLEPGKGGSDPVFEDLGDRAIVHGLAYPAHGLDDGVLKRGQRAV